MHIHIVLHVPVLWCLSDTLDLQETTLPAFDKIEAQHVVPGIKQLLEELNANLDELEEQVQPTWEGLVVPLERLSDRIERNWGAVTHLKVGQTCEFFLSM